MKRIGRYLKATHNRGLIIKPSSGVLKIGAYLDANVAGMYGYEHHYDPSCVKNWTGYVINVENCPVNVAIQIANGNSAFNHGGRDWGNLTLLS